MGQAVDSMTITARKAGFVKKNKQQEKLALCPEKHTFLSDGCAVHTLSYVPGSKVQPHLMHLRCARMNSALDMYSHAQSQPFSTIVYQRHSPNIRIGTRHLGITSHHKASPSMTIKFQHSPQSGASIHHNQQV